MCILRNKRWGNERKKIQREFWKAGAVCLVAARAKNMMSWEDNSLQQFQKRNAEQMEPVHESIKGEEASLGTAPSHLHIYFGNIKDKWWLDPVKELAQLYVFMVYHCSRVFLGRFFLCLIGGDIWGNVYFLFIYFICSSKKKTSRWTTYPSFHLEIWQFSSTSVSKEEKPSQKKKE